MHLLGPWLSERSSLTHLCSLGVKCVLGYLSQHVASMLAVTDVTFGDMQQTEAMADVHKLFTLLERRIGCFHFYKCCAKSMECTPVFVKIALHYPPAIISVKRMKFTVSYTPTIKGGNVVEKDLSV